MLGQLFHSEFIAPFTKRGNKYKRRAIQKRGLTGVYVIRENGIIVYVGMSQSCITTALYRHFYYYNDTHRKPRTYYNIYGEDSYTVFVFYTSKDDAPKLERGLVLGIQPRDNRDKFQQYLDALCVKNIDKSQQAAEVPTEYEDLPF